MSWIPLYESCHTSLSYMQFTACDTIYPPLTNTFNQFVLILLRVNATNPHIQLDQSRQWQKGGNQRQYILAGSAGVAVFVYRGEAMYISVIDFQWYCTKISSFQ